MSIIHLKNLVKDFQLLKRHPGLEGAICGLFSSDYRLVKAVEGISFSIEPGKIVGYIGLNSASN